MKTLLRGGKVLRREFGARLIDFYVVLLFVGHVELILESGFYDEYVEKAL